MMRFILVRHGHVEGIEPERFRGRADLSLTKQGEGQAQALAAGCRPTHLPDPLSPTIATVSPCSTA